MSDTPRTDESRGYYGYDDACPAYDMQKIERELAASQAGQAKWQALAEGLAGAAADYMTKCPADADETPSFYAAGLGLSQALAAYEAAKAGGLPAPLAEAAKTCDWKEDEDGNWYTACHQFMCFEHAPPNEQGYKFCHRCGHPINFIEFAPPLDEPPGPA